MLHCHRSLFSEWIIEKFVSCCFGMVLLEETFQQKVFIFRSPGRNLLFRVLCVCGIGITERFAYVHLQKRYFFYIFSFAVNPRLCLLRGWVNELQLEIWRKQAVKMKSRLLSEFSNRFNTETHFLLLKLKANKSINLLFSRINPTFWCILLRLAIVRDGHATIFIFKLNSFHVHVLTYIVLPLSPFFAHCCQIYFLCMPIWAKIKWLIDWYKHCLLIIECPRLDIQTS